jgi:hypothetical protein
MPEQITISIAAGGDDADARAFRSAFGDILDILDALTKEQLGSAEAAKWRIIRLEKKSPPQITIECRQNVRIARDFLYGLGEIQQRSSRPFPTRAMKAVRRLGRRIERREIDSITLVSPGINPISPTAHIARNAEAALTEKYYVVPSSVDGKLDVVNVHHRTKFSVFDDLHYREVRCYFPDSLFDAVKKNLSKRVTVIGQVRFDATTDRPISITVEDIEPLDEDEMKPKLFSEMNPINITGDVSSEDYVRRLRDGG